MNLVKLGKPILVGAAHGHCIDFQDVRWSQMISQITFNKSWLSEIDPVTLNTLKTLYAGAAVTLDDRMDDQRMILDVTSDCPRTGTSELAPEVEDQLRHSSWM